MYISGVIGGGGGENVRWPRPVQAVVIFIDDDVINQQSKSLTDHHYPYQ